MCFRSHSEMVLTFIQVKDEGLYYFRSTDSLGWKVIVNNNSSKQPN